MKKSLMKNNNQLNLINNFLISLPTPLNISIWWNFGSLLGLCLMIQIISGLFLSFHYSSNINLAFNSIIHIIQDVNNGWLIRLIHMNGASFFFICLFIHIGRSLYYNSFLLIKVWISGIFILLLVMMTAFLGYVLPWGQMSFWGATVITNLITAIPYIGNNIVLWLWGGFSIDKATLIRFYSFHFILPFIIIIFILSHLIFLHELGSSNPLGINSNLNKIKFHSYYSIKDILGFILMLMLLFLFCLIKPYILGDPENFNMANSMITPIHIQPEWYFLFAYAILRSIPNKLGGVIALFMSILILLILVFYNLNYKGNNINYLNNLMFWYFLIVFFLLTWIGSCPVEIPYILLGQIFSFLYFLYFFLINYMNYLNKFLMN